MPTAFERIRDDWVPLWLKGFERKARDYNASDGSWEPHEVLGVKGQFADIWRKIGKLKKSLWHDEVLEGEQPIEIIDDLISHLFLTRDLLMLEEQTRQRAREERLVIDRHRIVEGWTSNELLVGHRYDGCPACVKRKGS